MNQPNSENNSFDHIQMSAQVSSQDCGRRLDQVASELFSDYSRARLQSWIKGGQLRVDGQIQVPKQKLLGGETLVIDVYLESEGDWQPENIPLHIVYEDEHIIVLNKPDSLVVHPAAGNRSGTS